MSPAIRRAAIAVLFVAVLAACGQKPGVHQANPGTGSQPSQPVAGGQPPPGDDATGPVDPNGLTNQPGPSLPGQIGNAPAGVVSGGNNPTGNEQPTAASTSGPRPTQVLGSDRTGVTDTTITLAAHAPVTGAAPLPATVFEQSADLYWRWLRDVQGEKVLGRDIELVFQDDRYTPSTARQVCRQLMEVGFLLTGVGADGIAACAPLAEQLRVPYVAFGADEGDLAGLSWYFATAATYPQQGELFSQYTRTHFPGSKAGAIAIDTSSWDAAVAAWEAGLANRSIPFATALRHPREGTDWYAPFARELDSQGVEIVYALTSPLHLIRFSQVARDQGFDFHFLYIAPGGLNAILENGCPAMGNATAFSAWPSLDIVDQIEPEFLQAIERYDISLENLDLSLALWGANKFGHHMFLEYERRYGTDLTREDFRDMVETSTISTGLFPDQVYTPNNHFGTTPGVHVLKADCDREIWADGGTFKTNF